MDCRFPIADFRLHKSHGRKPVSLPPPDASSDRKTHGLTPVALSRPFGNRKSAIGNGFTLTELLVVIGLIVVLISLAVPAFSALRGSNSVESATNVVSASLARARAEAVGLQRPFGIAFYREAATARFAMALVELKTPAAWSPDTDYSPADWIRTGTSPNYSYYVCKTAHNSGPTFATTNWRAVHSTTNGYINNGKLPVDLVAGSDRLLMPTGIASWVADSTYLDAGVILFDENGTLAVRQVTAAIESEFYQQIVPTAGAGPIGPGNTPTTQIGLMLFQDEDGKAAGYSAAWISANATPLLVNRYNGTIVKGE